MVRNPCPAPFVRGLCRSYSRIVPFQVGRPTRQRFLKATWIFLKPLLERTPWHQKVGQLPNPLLKREGVFQVSPNFIMEEDQADWLWS